MTDPSFYAPLARAAEEAGYDSMVVPDSLCYPLESVSTYPFNPDGTRESRDTLCVIGLHRKDRARPFIHLDHLQRREDAGVGKSTLQRATGLH